MSWTYPDNAVQDDNVYKGQAAVKGTASGVAWGRSMVSELTISAGQAFTIQCQPMYGAAFGITDAAVLPPPTPATRYTRMNHCMVSSVFTGGLTAIRGFQLGVNNGAFTTNTLADICTMRIRGNGAGTIAYEYLPYGGSWTALTGAPTTYDHTLGYKIDAALQQKSMTMYVLYKPSYT